MSATSIHTEATFESAIIEHLCSNGWLQGNANDYNAELAFDKKAILSFIQESQKKEWEKLSQYYKDETESKFIQRLVKELELRGSLDVIRHGINDSACKFQLAYFKPDSNLNPDTVDLYKQ